MLTRRTQQLEAPSTQAAETGGPTLLSLPDVPLLQVLSYLSAKSLLAAGQASLRLRALARTHVSLWEWKDLYMRDIRRLVALMQLAPRVQGLKFIVRGWSPPRQYIAHFKSLKRRPRLLTLEVNDAQSCAAVVKELGTRFQLKHLEISGLKSGLGVFLDSLPHAPWLVKLRVCLEVYSEPSCTFRWPQEDLVLPRLTTVTFEDGERESEHDSAVLEALRSLLQAHRSQLRHVLLCSPGLLPLVDSCASGLERLTIAADGGVGAVLDRISGLNHLTILQTDDKAELDALLESCRCPLERLEILGCSDQVLRSLRSAGPGLGSLRHLELSCSLNKSWDGWSLQEALASLPSLYSLKLNPLWDPRPSDLLACLTTAAIPNLCLVVLIDDSRAASYSLTDYVGLQDCQDLVLRAPMPTLHVAVLLDQDERHGRRIVFCRHSVAKSVAALCPLCAEAAEAGFTWGYYKSTSIDMHFQVQ